MKWCRFQSGRNVAYGVIDGTTVTEVTGSLAKDNICFVFFESSCHEPSASCQRPV